MSPSFAPRSASDLIDQLATELGWPRSRPARLLVGRAESMIDGAAICADEDAIDSISTSGVAVLLLSPPSSSFARTGRRSYDVFDVDTPIDKWTRSERVILDAGELLTGGAGGIDEMLVHQLQATSTSPLNPVDRDDMKFVGYVPEDALTKVRHAMFLAGAGHIGNYDKCSWSTAGTGTFRPGPGTDPTLGTIGAFEQVPEIRFEMVVPAHLRALVAQMYVRAHPYEEPAFDIYPLRTPAKVGAGRITSLIDASAAADTLEEWGVAATRSVAHATPSSNDCSIVTSGALSQVLPGVLTQTGVRTVVCGDASDAERMLLAENGISLVVADRDALLERCTTQLAARLSRAFGIGVRAYTSLRFPEAPAAETANGEVTGRWTLNFDGGSRGNPGPAAFGFVLHDEHGNEVDRVGEVLGSTTNNVAEYTGLVRGLERARDHGVREINVLGDSELIVKQIKGEYRVKNAQLKPLWEQASQLMKGFDSASIAHVYRTDNAIADSLVNEALDAAR